MTPRPPRRARPAAVSVTVCLIAGALLAGSGSSAAPGRWTTAGLEGGFVETVAIDPSRPEDVMAGTRQGVFLSHDAGETWSAASTGLTQLNVRDVTFDRERPGVAYAGTTDGLFVTRDRGGLWSPLLPRRDTLEVDVLYGDDKRIVVNQTWALKTSGDGGLTWDVAYEERNHQLMDFAVSPTDPAVIYLVVADVGADARMVKRSADAGRSWTTVSQGIWPSSLVVDPRDPNVVYAVAAAGVVRTSDGGRTWETIRPAVDGMAAMLTMAPSAPDTLYLFGYHPDHAMFVSRSDDGGATWTGAGDVAEVRYPTDPVVSPADPNTLYLGTFGNGLSKSSDGGVTFRHVNRGLSAAPARDLDIDPRNPARVYAVTGFRGVFRSDDGGATWTDVMSGFADDTAPRSSIGVSAVTVDAASHVYAMRYVSEGPPALAVYRSEDGGDTWTSAGAPASGGRKLLAHPSRAGVLLAGGPGGLHRTEDRGVTWTAVGPIEEQVEDVVSAGGDTVYVATGNDHFGNADASRLYVSRDFGSTWERLAYPRIRHVISLAVRREPRILYAGAGPGSQVGVSLDGGNTWTVHELDATNHASSVTALAADPLDPTQVIAGTASGGLWVSRTGGATWLPTTPGIYGQEVYDVAFTPLPIDLPIDLPILRARPALAGVSLSRRSGVSRIVLAPHAFRRPSVRGDVSPGATVECRRGRWSRARSFGYRWIVDGERLDVTGDEYRVRPGDSAVACAVTGRGPGGRGRASSRAASVP